MAEKKHKISEKKIKKVKDLAKLMDSYNTTMLGTTVNLASAQFQKARKLLRGKAEISYSKKSTALRAIDASKKEGIKALKENITESPAFLFTNEDPFEIATLLSENKFPAKAKIGQIAPKEINIEAGPTDLLPGPVLSELGAAGIKAGIVGGKIAIKEGKTLVKEGDTITSIIAGVLQKLEILPFEVGLDTETAYDSNSKKVYTQIRIDKAGTLEELQNTFSTSYQFAIQMGYPTEETISQIIENAEREIISLDKAIQEAKPAEPAAEEPKAEEKPTEEKKESAQAEQPVEPAKAEEKPTENSSSPPQEGVKK